MFWKIKKSYYRSFQSIFKYTIGRIKLPEQKIISEVDAIKKLPEILEKNKINNIFIAISRSVSKLNTIQEVLESLSEKNITYTLFTDYSPNPTVENVDNGYTLYTKNNCQGIVAIGGGSVLDCAKVIAIKVTNKNKSCKQLQKIVSITKEMPFFIAVPTTAGSGSESTVAAVISDHSTNSKYAISSLFLYPPTVILDPKLTVGVPKHVTSTSGMDALTHALEAFLGNNGTKYTDKYALEATKLIFENLEKTYIDGSDLEARFNMLVASNYAGKAFTIALVGYVHSISHAISALYDLSHGLTNAVLLPYVLDFYGPAIYPKLAKIAIYTGIGNDNMSTSELALLVLNKIKNMNADMNIPNKIKEIRREDIEIIAQKALKEANPLYPVPVLLDHDNCLKLIEKCAVS